MKIETKDLYNKNNIHSLKFVSILLFASLGLSFFLILFPIFVGASASVGTIDSVYKYAKGIDNPNIKIDFRLFTGNIGVIITDDVLSGFAWGSNIGSINLSPTGWGVKNNTEGLLSGYASSDLGGWINFNGVTINSLGEFSGYATTEKLGRIVFNCSTDNSCGIDDFKLKTDWRPVSVRNNTTPAPTYTTPPDITPPIFDSSTTPIEENSSLPKNKNQEPLPIGDTSQYYMEGDVVEDNKNSISENTSENNATNYEIGKITIILPPDDSATETVPLEIKNIPETKANTSFSKTAKNITDFVKTTKKEAEELTDTPAIDISTKTVTTIGVAGGSTSLFSVFASGTLSFSEFSLTIFRFWSLFLSALGLRKRREPWGTVYDSITKQPLDPVYVILQDKKENEVATSITDLDGRYGFLVPPGVYRIFTQKTNYISPSLHLYGREKDEVYDNLYFGEEIEIGTSKTITKNIPMDPQGFDWNEFAKRDQKVMKFHSPHQKIFTQVSRALFFVGLLLAIVLYLVKPGTYNLSILILYAILSILRFIKFRTKSFGLIIDRTNGLPLPFSIVRIFQKDTDREMFHRVADIYGHYYCLLAKGEYYVVIDKKIEDGSYLRVYTSEPFVAKEGILNKDFKV